MDVWFLILVTLSVAASSEPQSTSSPPPPPTRRASRRALSSSRSSATYYGSTSPSRSSRTSSTPSTPATAPWSPFTWSPAPPSSSPPRPSPTRPLSTAALSSPTARHPPPPLRQPAHINTASYGSTWRILPRNLIAEILHPSRARTQVLDMLGGEGELKSQAGGVVRVVDHFQYAMFYLLVLMCFGDGLEEEQIKQIEDVQRRGWLSRRAMNMLNFWPRLSKLVLPKRWKEFYELFESRKRVLISLIRAQLKVKREQLSKAKEDGNYGNGDLIVQYVDTLLELELPEDKRKLEEAEIVSLCWEFLNAGTDTTSTALQWIMANLVKYPEIQERLCDEIKSVVGQGAERVKEEDLQRMSYLKAVVLEGLRRHPPGHFVLPHVVSEDTELGGYAIPKGAMIDFMVAKMGWDPEIWEDPMAFKPERFLNSGGGGEEASGFDITGSREIKMMPFGVGRRICPGQGLAMLHLEYFLANLVWLFKWRTVADEEVDLSEKQEFTTVMNNPLRAQSNISLLGESPLYPQW
ncbi:hypothetical protein BT93_H0795 [Corymbia citriodora subsp. variegata]|nr:hypothetical protein BT93_H0795 [Corymbia citriodora subsp. variegata]